MKQELIFKTAELVVMVITILVARYVIPWLKQKTEDEKIQKVICWIECAVRWAEQVYGDRTGAERKKLVYDIIEGIAMGTGVGLDLLTEQQIDMLIEAAVHTMNIGMGKYDPSVITNNYEQEDNAD